MIQKPRRWRPKRFIPLSLCVAACSALFAGCTLEDPAYSEYAKDDAFIQCPNVSMIYFDEGTAITASDPVFNGKDYGPAFEFGMCPAVSPHCVTHSKGEVVCSPCDSDEQFCYGTCLNIHATHVISCNESEQKTIKCSEGFADCDGVIANGCE